MSTTPPGTPADAFAEEWGEGLVRFPPAALADVRLPEDQKAFLAQVGLPAQAPWDVRFVPPAGPLPYLSTVPGADAVRMDLARFRPIGLDEGTHLCVDEGASGRIVAVDLAPGRKIPVRVVASSPRQLAHFLLRSREFLANRQLLKDLGRPPAAVEALIKELRQDLEQLDPQVMADLESFPAVIVEQIETGLL